MKVVHYFDEQNKIARETDQEKGFLLSNNLGGYLWLDKIPQSRYQGWFFTSPVFAGKKIFKIVEEIKVLGLPEISKIQNDFWRVQRSRGIAKESFFLPDNSQGLVYELSRPADVEIILDIKESYDSEEQGRHYEIFQSPHLTVIKFQKDGSAFPPIFLAIKSNGSLVSILNDWILNEYPFDKERNSFPMQRYVFRALKIEGAKKIVFAASFSQGEAEKIAEEVFKKSDILQKEKEKESKNISLDELSLLDLETRMGFICCAQSLRSFLVKNGPSSQNYLGLYGGLPWFFQFWQRDEALCLKALSSLDAKPAKEIFWQELENLIFRKEVFKSADALGWLLQRAKVFLREQKFTLIEIAKLKDFTEILAKEFLENQTKDKLALHHPKKTWMDTLERMPCSIEIQALRLSFYHLAGKINEDRGSKSGFYLDLEKKMAERVKKIFWTGKFLADGFDPEKQAIDLTVRPNVFLAYYIYPNLLSKNEWQKCFQNTLSKLWLPWGGLSTIDKENVAFSSQHTGEIPASYHQGDSWFFVNNLAALVLHRNDPKVFQETIKKILGASLQDILWSGILGHHSELSSADFLKSQGCLAQAWSAALYLELIQEMFGK